ncbi:hypothetical protein QBC44DRAFT_292124 [Cladorrhinum sp. PSN332]|nr:hypothetical protein QBC44DRAFT_292124 [Cladorrhinum sp. PSN332]
MDGLSLATAIMTVIQMTDHIVKLCKAYIDGVEDYPRDLALIHDEVKALSSILEDISKGDFAQDSSITKVLTGPNGCLERCRTAITELQGLIPTESHQKRSHNGTKRMKLGLTLEALAWPLKRDRAQKLLGQISTYKSTIQTAMTGSILHDVRFLKQSLDSDQKLQVYSWLERTNPSTNHNAALELYESGTGEWVQQTDEWKTWFTGPSRCLWIPGIPGAGKTVLAAHLTQTIETSLACSEGTGNQQRTACIYYYCWHARESDESSSLLRWAISQLSRDANEVSKETYKLFQRGRDPTPSELLSTLGSILTAFDKVFFTIDALDESSKRFNLLSTITTLASDVRFGRLKLLTTSRMYKDITEAMSKISVALSMRHHLVEADIKQYVKARIARETHFRQWNQDLRDEVGIKLSQGAQGMFRWAVCQLDILRRLRTVDRIRDSIRYLPESLDATYDRIFSLIHEQDRRLVRHVLHWIWFQGKALGSRPGLRRNVSALISSCRFYEARELLGGCDPSLVMCDVDTIRECCGCLITFVTDENTQPVVSIAHYTVREYLESGRIPAAYSEFTIVINPPVTYREMCNFALHHAIEQDFSTAEVDPFTLEESDEFYCLVTALDIITEPVCAGDPNLVFRFLDKSRPRFSRLAIITEHPGPHGVSQSLNPMLYSSITDSAMSTEICTLLNLLNHQTRLAKVFIETNGGDHLLTSKFSITISYRELEPHLPPWTWKLVCGTIIEFIASHPLNLASALNLLLDTYQHLINPTQTLLRYIGNHLPYSRSHSKCFGGTQCVIWKLLQDCKADANGTCSQLTPLQIAVANLDITTTRMLLNSGADPNYCGNPEGHGWYTDDGNLQRFDRLRGKKPLLILRYNEWESILANHPLFRDEVPRLKDARDILERLLISYGASGTNECQESGLEGEERENKAKFVTEYTSVEAMGPADGQLMESLAPPNCARENLCVRGVPYS